MQARVIAEFSITPIGSGSTSVGREVGAAIRAIKKAKGIRFETNAMGTILESKNLDPIFEAVKLASDSIFQLGEKRVQTILKIDDRRDKARTIESKLESAKKYSK